MQKSNHSPRTIIKNGLLKGISIGAGIGIGLITTTLFAAAAAMKVFSAGEVISATELNRNFTMAAPEGAVMAFYLSACPEGWTPADGSPGTPDLRGRFIRGLNDFGTGVASVDPQGMRALGSVQTDAFQGHWMGITHSLHTAGSTNNIGFTPYPADRLEATETRKLLAWANEFKNDGVNGEPRTSSETRPVNVGLIYCVRKN